MVEPKLRFKADDGSQFPDWERKKIVNVSDRVKVGFVGTCECYYTDESGIRLYRTGNLQKGRLVEDDMKYVLKKFHEANKKSQLHKWDILIARHGNSGNAVLYDSDGEANCLNIVIIRPDLKVVNPKFMVENINSASVEKQVCRLKNGSTQVVLNTKAIEDLDVGIPCLPEQQKIAEFLSTIDTVIEKQKETVSAWEERKKGVMQKLFSQEVRFKADDGSDFPDWEEKTLSEIASIHARIGWQNLRKDEFLTDGNYLLITGTDFCNGRVNFSTCYYVDKERYEQDKNIQVENGTILVTKDGTLGKVALVENLNKPATLNAGVFAIKVIHADTISKFLYHWLAAPMLLEYASKKSTGGTIKHLNQGILVDFPVGVPCIAGQRKIADCLSSLDEVIEKQKATLAAWEELKKGLLQQMFV